MLRTSTVIREWLPVHHGMSRFYYGVTTIVIRCITPISKNMYGQTTVGHDWCRSSKNATTNDYGGATVHHDISRFPCSPVGTHVVFTQDIVQFVCLLYTLSQFVQLEKCVGSLMRLPFPLSSHYPLIDRWSQSCIGVSFEYNAETTCMSFVNMPIAHHI